ncbi:MAG: hypothetical protein HRT66_02160 [Flavobacteriaceae bacterium]|nr:hypothetical protein [Flavobacteriaceae bacterium]
MSNLMNEMYAFNEKIKKQILAGEKIDEYSEIFKNIHSAKLTSQSDRDDTFEAFSEIFLEKEKNIFHTDKNKLIKNYNIAINACINCHKVKCGGPITRIKKLLIK